MAGSLEEEKERVNEEDSTEKVQCSSVYDVECNMNETQAVQSDGRNGDSTTVRHSNLYREE